MRLIDADLLKNKKRLFRIDEYGDRAVTVEDIDDTPTIDAEPVIHAKPNKIMPLVGEVIYYECSNCKHLIFSGYKYCSHCGAKMDLE